MRELIAMTLKNSRFEVVLAATGAEALSLVEDGLPFAGLYTDIRLAGHIDGWAVGAAFSERWPAKMIVYASAREYPAELVSTHSGVFWRKPFDVAALPPMFAP
jgi:DNA-binding NtrC family response regulator